MKSGTKISNITTIKINGFASSIVCFGNENMGENNRKGLSDTTLSGFMTPSGCKLTSCKLDYRHL